MRTPFSRSILCGSLPLATGVVIWALWRATRIDTLMLVGMGAIVVGLLVSVLGSVLWIVDAISVSRSGVQRPSGVKARAILAIVLLLGCYPVAGAIIQDVARVMTEYRVVIDNDSGEDVTSCRVFGGGVDTDLGPVAAGESAETAFEIGHDDELRCTVVVAGETHDLLLEAYVTNSLAGHASITVDAEGVPTVDGPDR